MFHDDVRNSCDKITKVRLRLIGGGLLAMFLICVTINMDLSHFGPFAIRVLFDIFTAGIVIGEAVLIGYVKFHTMTANNHRSNRATFNRSLHMEDWERQKFNM